MATKTVTSWSNALDEPGLFNIDAPNDDQCGLFDVGAPSYDQRGSFDAPNDNNCALKESVVALPKAFVDISPLNLHLDTVIKPRVPVLLSLLPHHTLEQVDAELDDAAERFGRSAPLDTAATERAVLRVQKKEGVACPPWWLPSFMGDRGQVVYSGSQVAHVDVDDGKRRDLTSHQPAEQLTPADIPSHAPLSSEPFDPVRPLSFIAKRREMTAWWTSSALLCALMFLLSAYAFNGKVPTSLSSSCTPCALFRTLPPLSSAPHGRRTGRRRKRGLKY